MKYCLFFLICLPIFSISQPLKLTIDQITATDSTYRRSFNIDFSIQNTSDQEISFFLDPTNFTPAQSGPLSNAVFYKIYHNNDEVSATNILSYRISEQEFQSRKAVDYSELYIETLRKNHQDKFFNSLIILRPQEKINYRKELLWNFERYQKNGDHEYFLESDQPYYLELLVIFWREEYVSKTNESQYQSILENKSLIKGWFASNKVAIDFSDKKAE